MKKEENKIDKITDSLDDNLYYMRESFVYNLYEKLLDLLYRKIYLNINVE